jgi:hypothetical protein
VLRINVISTEALALNAATELHDCVPIIYAGRICAARCFRSRGPLHSFSDGHTKCCWSENDGCPRIAAELQQFMIQSTDEIFSSSGALVGGGEYKSRGGAPLPVRIAVAFLWCLQIVRSSLLRDVNIFLFISLSEMRVRQGRDSGTRAVAKRSEGRDSGTRAVAKRSEGGGCEHFFVHIPLGDESATGSGFRNTGRGKKIWEEIS